MKSQLIIIVVGICLSAQLTAQNQMSNWFFSDSIHIKFTEDTIEVGSLPIYPSGLTESTNRNYTILSDTSGDVLLYKDSYFIYNKDGIVLNDSITLLSAVYPWASIILPDIKDGLYYYILNIEQFTGILSYCRIEKVDSVGSVFFQIEECNVLIDESGICPNRLAIVKHGNGLDWWFVNKVHVLSDSLQPISVRLFADSDFGAPDYYYSELSKESFYFQSGQMIFNESGNQLAIENALTVRLFGFDRCTGEIIPECLIDTLEGFAISSIAYSKSGDYLYVATDGHHAENLDYVSRIWQFDIASSGSCNEWEESMQLVYEESAPYDYWNINSMLLERISGRIYFSVLRRYLVLGDDTITGPQNLHLHAIIEPDLPGELCNVQENALYLDGMFVSEAGLPNMPNYALGAWEGSPCDTLNETNSVAEVTSLPFRAYPNPVQDYLYIDNPLQTTCQAVVFNAMGQEVERFMVQPGGQTVSTTTWPTGIYQLIVQQENDSIWKQSLLKME